MPRKITRRGLIKKLDSIVSKIVIAREKKCVQCGSTQNLTCGHIFSRSHYATRWNLDNCHAQCWPCNYKYKNQDTVSYFLWYQNKVGKKKVNKLYKKWKEITHFKDFELVEMYEKLLKIYNNLCK